MFGRRIDIWIRFRAQGHWWDCDLCECKLNKLPHQKEPYPVKKINIRENSLKMENISTNFLLFAGAIDTILFTSYYAKCVKTWTQICDARPNKER